MTPRVSAPVRSTGIIGPTSIDDVGVQLFIDPEECIGCAACVTECPVDAIYDEDSVPVAHHADIARNAKATRH